MSELLDSPGVKAWVDGAMGRHSKGIFGTLKSAVIWTDAQGNDGELIVPVDPTQLVSRINNNPHILLHGHDPGRPKGQVLESASFENDGKRFVAAIFGFYAGGDVLGFGELGIDLAEATALLEHLPDLPDDFLIQVAVDSREVDATWLDQVTSDAPVLIERVDLSHNAAESVQELIKVGIAYVALVWNPFVKALASEAGTGTYAAVHKWVRKVLEKLAQRRNPVLEIQSHRYGCQVSFLFRGKDVKLLYAAHDSLAKAATQAERLIAKLSARGMSGRQLIYEFDKDALMWFPSYAVLDDNRIITDNRELIALEQLPTGISLGLVRGKPELNTVKSASDADQL
jgi:hypothetical protein